MARDGAVHCELKGVKLSFLFYKEPLIYPQVVWRNINVSDWRDITAEKFKAISQRGSKRDFYDLYAVLKMKLTIGEACEIFKKRFRKSVINRYHVLKSLVFFEDAESEPEPILHVNGKDWEWASIKSFFENNIKNFEAGLL